MFRPLAFHADTRALQTCSRSMHPMLPEFTSLRDYGVRASVTVIPISEASIPTSDVHSATRIAGA